MESKKIKMGIVGLNRGKDVITTTWGDPLFTLTAICDKNPDRLKEGKKHFEKLGAENLFSTTDLDELLRSDIDAVLIATDATLHTPQVIKALEAGKHVISEIPTVNSIEEARQLKAAVMAHPRQKYMCAENCCFWAFIDSWKKMHDAGRFGEVVYAESEYLHASEPDTFVPLPDGYWRASYNAIKYLTHNLGPLLYILDDRCVSVSCIEPPMRYNPYKSGSENGIALFRTAKGRAIRIFIGFGVYVGFDHNFALYGTKGSILTDKTKPYKEAHSFAKMYDTPGTFEEAMEIPLGTSYSKKNLSGHGGADSKMMHEFFRCILEDTKPPIDVDLGIAMAIPGIYAHESAMNGGALVEIPEIL
jgi:predicted dehydrogenase